MGYTACQSQHLQSKLKSKAQYKQATLSIDHRNFDKVPTKQHIWAPGVDLRVESGVKQDPSSRYIHCMAGLSIAILLMVEGEAKPLQLSCSLIF